MKGTRGAVLDEIELWTKDLDRSPVYWLNGLAGTGKSTIAQTIAKRTFASGRLGASFFCSRDFSDRSDLQFIFPTLAVQLARNFTEFRSTLIPLVRSDPGIVNESLYRQMEKVIVRPFKESGISTVIIIDALDECRDDQPASAILSVLGQLVSEIPKVKFFLTGRPERWIREGFRLPRMAEATDVFILHEIEPRQIGGDIRLFFKKSFSELASRQDGPEDWPTEEQLDLLCERAAGLFTYAVATVKFIDHKNNDPEEQLDRLIKSSESSAREGKTKLRGGMSLDSLYMTILREAFDGDDPGGRPQDPFCPWRHCPGRKPPFPIHDRDTAGVAYQKCIPPTVVCPLASNPSRGRQPSRSALPQIIPRLHHRSSPVHRPEISHIPSRSPFRTSDWLP